MRKEEILQKTNKGLNVFKHYISFPFQIGKNFLNPLYDDKKASCNIYFDRKSNAYKLKDFGNSSYSGDCFFFVGILKGLDCNNPTDFIEILRIIEKDLCLNISGSVSVIQHTQNMLLVKERISPERNYRPYTIRKKRFSAQELNFWEQSGITEKTLKRYNICSLSSYKSVNNNKNPYTLFSTNAQPIFCYENKEFVKIYRPFSKIRFLYGGLLPEHYIFGLKQLPQKGDILFITGGERDVLSLSAHGFNAICFNSETAFIPPLCIYMLNTRFQHIVLLFDVDKTGLESSERQVQNLSEYGVKRLLLPLTGKKNDKDITDLLKYKNGLKRLKMLISELIDKSQRIAIQPIN